MSAERNLTWTIRCDETDCPHHVRTRGETVTEARHHVARFGWQSMTDGGETVDICPNAHAETEGRTDG